MAGCKSSTRLSLRTMSTSTAADITSVNAAGKSQRKRPKDAVTTLDEVSLGARSNSADVPTKIGSAAEPKPDRRERRLTGAMASLQELSELKEKQRLAALQKKLLPYDGHCWCCLMADCTHEPGSDECPQCETTTPDMNARLGTTHLRRPTDVAGCDGVLLITEMEANALAICSMTGERLRTVCFEPVFEAIKPTSVTVIEQASGPSLMAVITQNWLLVLTLDGKVRQRVPARTRFQCARATEQRLLVSDIDAHIVHEFRFE
jgi:hypothetical protein